jgi:hypothetical protein
MTERGRNLVARSHRRRPLTLYRSVLDEIDPRVLAAASTAEGLDDEVLLLRLLLRRHLLEHPGDLELTLKGMHLLVRMVVARFKLSGTDAAALEEGVRMALDQFSSSVLGKEPIDG